jgi:hypothetical protein
MSSERLVRCEVRSPGSEGPGSTRYVPAEIFGLWTYLMRTKHSFEVKSEEASLWMDVEEKPEAAYSETHYDRVVEITLLFYSEKEEMFDRVRRYLPLDDYPRLKEILLSHYIRGSGGSELMPQIKERKGIWVHRSHEPSAPEAGSGLQ